MTVMTRKKFNLPLIVMIMAALIACFLVLYPLIYLVYGSLRTAMPGEPGVLSLDNFITAFTAHKLGPAIINTLILMVGTTLLSCPIGVFLVWITTRTDTPFRRQLEIANIFPFLLSPYVAAVAWSLLLSPRVGLLNTLFVKIFNLQQPLFDIYSIPGAICVLVLYYIPYMYLYAAVP